VNHQAQRTNVDPICCDFHGALCERCSGNLQTIFSGLAKVRLWPISDLLKTKTTDRIQSQADGHEARLTRGHSWCRGRRPLTVRPDRSVSTISKLQKSRTQLTNLMRRQKALQMAAALRSMTRGSWPDEKRRYLAGSPPFAGFVAPGAR
jgi:hypothetical protein